MWTPRLWAPHYWPKVGAAAVVAVGPFLAEMTAQPVYSAEARADATYSVEATAQGA